MVRLKHRYLLLQILYPPPPTPSALPAPLAIHAPTPDTLTPALLARLIRDALADLFGDHGAGTATASLSVKYLSCPTSTAIVRVARAQFRLVWAALTMVTRLPAGRGEGRGAGRECVVRVVRVSGTVRKAEEEVVRRGRAMVARAEGGWGLEGREERIGTDVMDEEEDDDD